MSKVSQPLNHMFN